MNFYVADWYVDVDANQIIRDSLDIKLESKVMLLLMYLAKHQGQVLSREQLEADIWVDRVISYDALTSCITKLRKVLGDDSRKPVYIETVPKKGYRLIAPVSWENAKQTPGLINPEGESTNQKSRRNTVFLALGLAFLITAITFATLYSNKKDYSSETANAISIVVLPFDNLGSNPDQTYLSDGITADIRIALSKISGLLVIAGPSLLPGSDAFTSMIDTNARYALTGSVQKAGNKLRVNAILLDNETHYQLWAESYNREIVSVFEVQDDITDKIISALSIKITDDEKKRVANHYTNSIDAYDQFLRGQALYAQHKETENLLAREHLRVAIDLDPNFSRAYAALSLTYIDEYRHQWFSNSEQSLLNTLSLAEKAVSIDSKLPQAHWALAYAQLYLHRYKQAMESAANSLKMNPNYADGHAMLALINIYNGNPGKGVSLIRQAMRLNPDYPAQYLSVLGQAYYFQGEYDSALTLFRNAIDKNYNLLSTNIMLIATLSQLGISDEAIWQANQLRVISPELKLANIDKVLPFKDKAKLYDIVEQLRLAGIE